MWFKTSYFSVTAVFQCYLFQGKIILMKFFQIHFFSHFTVLGNFIHFEFTFLKLFSTICGKDGSLQNGGGNFLEIWTNVNVYEMVLILGS